MKWKGYEDLADHTWEPEEGLKYVLGELSFLNSYYAVVNGAFSLERARKMS